MNKKNKKMKRNEKVQTPHKNKPKRTLTTRKSTGDRSKIHFEEEDTKLTKAISKEKLEELSTLYFPKIIKKENNRIKDCNKFTDEKINIQYQQKPKFIPKSLKKKSKRKKSSLIENDFIDIIPIEKYPELKTPPPQPPIVKPLKRKPESSKLDFNETHKLRKAKVRYLLSFGKKPSRSHRISHNLVSPSQKHRQNLKKILEKNDTFQANFLGALKVKKMKNIDNYYQNLRKDQMKSMEVMYSNVKSKTYRDEQNRNSSYHDQKSGYRKDMKNLNELLKFSSREDLYSSLKLKKSRKDLTKLRVENDKNLLDLVNKGVGRLRKWRKFEKEDSVEREKFQKSKSWKRNKKNLNKEVVYNIYREIRKSPVLNFKTSNSKSKERKKSSKIDINNIDIRILELTESDQNLEKTNDIKTRRKFHKRTENEKFLQKIKVDRNTYYEYKVYNPETPRDNYTEDSKNRASICSKRGIFLRNKKMQSLPRTKFKSNSKRKKGVKYSILKRKRKKKNIFDDINQNPSSFGAWKTGPDTLPGYIKNRY